MIAAQRGVDDDGSVVDPDSLPRAVREIEHGWIPLADGARLAYRCWLPADAEENPVPALLEYIPYCKRDGTSARDEAMHPWFAGQGYASFRVDLRGSGESDGVLLGEYLERELADAEEVIAWLAAQPWCTGRVGMFGKSWGGFNCLQVAARRPPALKAIVTVCSTDDRYATDIHTMGGCQLLENPNWCFTMFGHNARPPDPVLFGEGWRDAWFRRMENSPPWVLEWLRHQRRDDFWKHGSVCEDFSAIACPVFAVGGWLDPYTDPALRLMEGLDVPRRAWIGPLGAPVSPPGASGTGGGVPAGELPMVGPVAQGPGYRHRPGADDSRLDARQLPAGDGASGGAGTLDRRARLAAAGRELPAVVSEPERPRGSARVRERRFVSLPGHGRARQPVLGPQRNGGAGEPVRPAAGRRHVALLR